MVFDIMMAVPQLLHSCNQMYVAGEQTHQCVLLGIAYEMLLKAFSICQYIMLTLKLRTFGMLMLQFTLYKLL